MRTERVRWFVCGALTLGAIGALAGAAFVVTARGFSAREEPSGIERWIARRVRAAALPADASKAVNPAPATPETMADARAHWADHCASCHANDGSGDTMMGRRTYPPAPDMRRPETRATHGRRVVLYHSERRPSDRDAGVGRVRRR